MEPSGLIHHRSSTGYCLWEVLALHTFVFHSFGGKTVMTSVKFEYLGCGTHKLPHWYITVHVVFYYGHD